MGPDLFWVTFIGQTLVAVPQVFMLSVPPSLSACTFMGLQEEECLLQKKLSFGKIVSKQRETGFLGIHSS